MRLYGFRANVTGNSTAGSTRGAPIGEDSYWTDIEDARSSPACCWMAIATAALAQKQGGILRVQHRDGPASMSILEEGTISAISRTQPRATTTAAVAGSFLIGTTVARVPPALSLFVPPLLIAHWNAGEGVLRPKDCASPAPLLTLCCIKSKTDCISLFC